MKRFNVIIFFILIVPLNLFSQDSSWKKVIVDDNLNISFPGHVSSMDTTLLKEDKEWRFKLFKCEKETYTLALVITPSETNLKVDNEETWHQALTEMSRGALKSLADNGLSCSTIDTTIDELPCKKLTCNKEGILLMYDYIFLINDKMYAIQTVFLNRTNFNQDLQDQNIFLNSIRFTKNSIKEKQFLSKAESSGYKIGYILGGLLLVAVIIGIIVYFVNRT